MRKRGVKWFWLCSVGVVAGCGGDLPHRPAPVEIYSPGQSPATVRPTFQGPAKSQLTRAKPIVTPVIKPSLSPKKDGPKEEIQVVSQGPIPAELPVSAKQRAPEEVPLLKQSPERGGGPAGLEVKSREHTSSIKMEALPEESKTPLTREQEMSQARSPAASSPLASSPGVFSAPLPEERSAPSGAAVASPQPTHGSEGGTPTPSSAVPVQQEDKFPTAGASTPQGLIVSEASSQEGRAEKPDETPVPGVQEKPVAEASAATPAVAAQEASPATLAPRIPLKGMKFMWPVLGSLVAEFGPTSDGLHNDGINIKIRKGTPVRAAEQGEVVFVGDQVKGFGSLILIKHANNWTTTYAHMQKIIVEKKTKVKRGQVIGYSGDSGNVTSPQLHFELRHQIKPVNPMNYLVPQ